MAAATVLPKTLDDLVLFNLAHKAEELQAFGQERFEDALKINLSNETCVWDRSTIVDYYAPYCMVAFICSQRSVRVLL